MKSVQRVLVVKTSSMGDVIHMLPAITDMARACPEIQIDWVVEEGFASIPGWHPAVNRVIPVAVRRWRKNLFSLSTWRQIRSFRKLIREAPYDLVIDSQGLFKSAVLASWAKKPVAGMDKHSAREPVASFFYRYHYPVARGQHAVPRNRQLVAQALGYSLQDMPLDYGLNTEDLKTKGLETKGLETSELTTNSPKIDSLLETALIETPSSGQHNQGGLPERFVIFLHAASAPEKEWPVKQWISLGRELNKRGLTVLLPWGNKREQGNAQAIERGLDLAQVLPRLGLDELAMLFIHAEVLVGEDSGLSHMAAALGRPVVALYLVTDPALTGVMGSEINQDNRVMNYRVTGEEQAVEKVVAILDDWLPVAD